MKMNAVWRYIALFLLKSTLRFDRPNFDFEKYDADGRFGFGEGSARVFFPYCKRSRISFIESPYQLIRR
jgi:hypothetical protein